MANLITIFRLFLLFVVVAMLYRGGAGLTIVSMALIAIVIAGDGVDGYVARRRGTTSRFGAVFDIAGDRVVEMVLWIIFADLDVIPVWIPLMVVTRGALVDAMRSLSYADGMTAFGERNMMRSDLSRWLTAGRFMRGLFGYAKAIAFIFLAGEVGFGNGSSGLVADLYDATVFRFLGWLTVWTAVALTIIRGIPVIVDSLQYLGQSGESSATLRSTTRPTDHSSASSGQA